MNQASDQAELRHVRQRVLDLDVSRAVALIGVCVMNYHGYLILRTSGPEMSDDSLAARVFNPWEGPLSTRFAAAFVVVAGMGVTLMTRSAIGNRARQHILRWVLIRRGVLLFAAGYLFDWVWPGTILGYYGAMFVIAAFIFTLRSAAIATIGVGAAVAGAAIQRWTMYRADAGHDVGWLHEPGPRSPRALLFNTFVNGTHPVLPWLAFLCLGIVIARLIPWTPRVRFLLASAGTVAVVVAYIAHNLAPNKQMFDVTPWSRSVAYTLCAAGSAVAGVCIVGALAQATHSTLVSRALAAAGRCTLTLYIAHALVFNLLVDWLGWIRPTGLDTALLFAGGFWLIGIIAAAWWVPRQGVGPLERIYRRFSS